MKNGSIYIKFRPELYGSGLVDGKGALEYAELMNKNPAKTPDEIFAMFDKKRKTGDQQDAIDNTKTVDGKETKDTQALKNLLQSGKDVAAGLLQAGANIATGFWNSFWKTTAPQSNGSLPASTPSKDPQETKPDNEKPLPPKNPTGKKKRPINSF